MLFSLHVLHAYHVSRVGACVHFASSKFPASKTFACRKTSYVKTATLFRFGGRRIRWQVPLGFDSAKFERCTETQTTESDARRLAGKDLQGRKTNSQVADNAPSLPWLAVSPVNSSCTYSLHAVVCLQLSLPTTESMCSHLCDVCSHHACFLDPPVHCFLSFNCLIRVGADSTI
jgi:hypothetical protein